MMRTPKDPEATPVPEAATEDLMPVSRREPSKRLRNRELETAIGARIRAARVAARMSQTELGNALGISFQQVQKYERGQDRIAVSTLQGLATVLGVRPGSFFDNDVPVPSGSVPNVKAAMRLVERFQRVRNPVVLQRMLALVDLLAETEDAEKVAVVDQPDGGGESR